MAVNLTQLLVTQELNNKVQLAEALQDESDSHAQTLALLRAVVNGEVAPEQVVVSDDGWQVMPAMPQADSEVEEQKPSRSKRTTTK